MKATITDVLSQSKLAAQAYARLLHQYPDATLVLRLHAAFAQDVLNDSDFAKALVARAEQLDEWQAAEQHPGRAWGQQVRRWWRKRRGVCAWPGFTGGATAAKPTPACSQSPANQQEHTPAEAKGEACPRPHVASAAPPRR